MATLSSLRHNPRLKAHYERLTQRVTRPVPPMQGQFLDVALHEAPPDHSTMSLTRRWIEALLHGATRQGWSKGSDDAVTS